MSKLTVVFEINDNESFSSMKEKIFEKFHGGDNDGWAVRFVSLEDESKRLSDIESLIDRLSPRDAVIEINEVISNNPDDYDVESIIEEYE